MGSRIQHIAFIVFALLFVAIIAVINTGILNMGTNANKTLSTTVQTSNSSTLELYNNTTISGDTVANAAKNPDSLANTSMTVFVVTKADGDKVRAYTNSSKYQAKSNEDWYINSSAQFKSYLCENDNGVVSGILFVQDTSKYSVQDKVTATPKDGTAITLNVQNK